jgi:N-dimethylarginine dimethylaminohydrolase
MSFDFGSFNNWGALRAVAVRDPADAFIGEDKIAAEWRALNFHAAPDMAAARREYDRVLAILEATGAEVIKLPQDARLTLDSLYTHDALVVTPAGLVLPHMGKAARRAEPEVNAAHLERLGYPVAGRIEPPGKVEGGDLVWLDRHTLLAGIGYRTNREGAQQLQRLCGRGVEVLTFDLPHYKGRGDVFHLMSVLSPLDRDLAVVYLPLMPVRLVELLETRGISFIEVPASEFDTMACNVLALGPRHAMMVAGNPHTERLIRAAGVTLEVVEAQEICRKGEGGPTCMTRPLIRA